MKITKRILAAIAALVSLLVLSYSPAPSIEQAMREHWPSSAQVRKAEVEYRITHNRGVWRVQSRQVGGEWSLIHRTNDANEAFAHFYSVVFGTQPQPTPTSHPSATPLPPTPTIPPTPTTPPTPTPHTHFGEDDVWHEPGGHGDRPPHEHGDRPPEWVALSDFPPVFSHAGMTPGENSAYWKHTAFKGYHGKECHGQEWYLILHQDFHPSGRRSRFHSFQLWILTPSRKVSYITGWLDFGIGNSASPLLVPNGQKPDVDDGVRPIMQPPTQEHPGRFEIWYHNPGVVPWFPDVTQDVNSNYFHTGNEDIYNPATWAIRGLFNLERNVSVNWYRFRVPDYVPLDRDFYATQWGEVVTGLNDPVCGTTRRFGDRTFQTVCLRNRIWSDTQNVHPYHDGMYIYPGCERGGVFPGAGIVTLPN